MKNYIQKFVCKGFILMAGASMVLTGCKESFLEPDPQTMFKPSEVFTTEAGLRSVLAICDRQLKRNYVSEDSREMMALPTEYTFSDLMVPAATDKSGFLDNVDNMLRSNSDQSTEKNLGRTNSIYFFWRQGYEGIRNANTLLSFIDDVPMDETLKKEYIGRAYFHRAYRYYALVFQFGHVPLLTQLTSSPKLNYRSTHRDAILEKMALDMEYAVQWVPEQKDMQYVGMVNKGACRMLLSKLYLALGKYEDAKAQLDILINQSGYSLMTNTFGTFFEGGEPASWPITRNVIWDLHRPENKLIAANKEVIMGMPNNTADSHTDFLTMRIFGPMWSDNGYLLSPDGKAGAVNYARNHANYDKSLDFLRAFGRGIATVSGATDFQQHGMWVVNGVEDTQDLRHNHEVGNWVRMEDLKYNNPESEYYGKNLQLYDDQGKILCTNLIRDWFDFPHYKIFLDDATAEANQGANQFNGATTGSNANWYLYRLAETYLLRAEAKLYQGKDATSDVNEVRRRAKCSQLYTSVNIGDIANERARELYLEEWRAMELKRISYCLALSGKPDEWGNTYSKDNWDKQSGTDATGGSYWYQRLTRYSVYNQNPNGITSGPNTLYFTLDKRNVYWPIPNDAITANNKAQLAQNYGYDGYDANIQMWDNWEDAVADEDITE